MGATCVLPSVASLTGRTVFRYIMKNQQCAFAQWRRGNHFTVTRGHFSKSLEECIHCRSNWVCCCVMCTKSRRWAAAAQLSFSSVQPKSFNSSPVVQRMTEVAISQLAEAERLAMVIGPSANYRSQGQFQAIAAQLIFSLIQPRFVKSNLASKKTFLVLCFMLYCHFSIVALQTW